VEEEVQAQTTKAAMMSGYLRDIIWRNKNMRSKIRIHKTCMRSVMICAIETKAETTITKLL
jgi:hypothetical protein